MSRLGAGVLSITTGLLAVTLWPSLAGATDFHVIEAHDGYELHRTGGGHGSFGVGYTWDTLLTVSIPRGFELGARLDVLHCPACEHKIDGAALLGSALVTAWKDDLSAITFYLGPAVGLGYSAETDKPFLELELQAAVQFRLIFDGLWIRPMLFGGAGGAYDGYTSVGLRLAVGYAVNHGQRLAPDTTPPVLPHVPGACDPPPSADLAASAVSWIVPNCFRKNASAHLGGLDVPVSDHGGDLEIRVGAATPGATQQVEIFVAGGSFPVQLRRP